MEEEKKLVRWSKRAVTNVGTAMLAEYAAGRVLNITSAFGSIGGDDDLTELEELADGRAHPLTIESVTRTDSSVTACIQVTSLGNTTPYKLERIGLFAITKDPGELEELDSSDGEIIREDKLLVVVEDVEDEHGSKGVTVPAESDQLYTFELYVVLTITNKDRLEISVSSAGIATLGAINNAVKEHNDDQEAHPCLTARVRAAELALNGSETILAPEGGPTIETVGEVGQHCIDPSTGTEYVCGGITAEGYVWALAEAAPSMREAMGEIEEISGAAAPTGQTAGIIGQKYTDTSTGRVYTCIAAAVGESGETNYTWAAGRMGTLADIRAALSNKADLSVQETVETASVPSRTVEVEAAELRGYIAGLPRLLAEDLTITVSGGTASGIISIRRFYGPGSLFIKAKEGETVIFNIRMEIVDCRVPVSVEGLSFQGPSPSGTCFHIVNSVAVLKGISMTGTKVSGQTGIASTDGSAVYMDGCAFNNFSYAVSAARSSIFSVENCGGSNNSYGFYVGGGGIILLSGTTPELMGGNSNVKVGGMIVKGNGTLL